MQKLAIGICLFSLMSFFVSAQDRKEEPQMLEASTSVEPTEIAISKGISLFLYPKKPEKFALVCIFKNGERILDAIRVFTIDEEIVVVEFSETTATQKTSRKTLLNILKTGSDARQLSVSAHVTLSERPLFPKEQERHPVDPILVIIPEVRVKRVHGQLLFSVLARIVEAVREQYSQNPEKKALDFSELKLDPILIEDIQVLLTSPVRSFYSKVTSKKAPVKPEEPE